MNLIVLGATGATGRMLVGRALERGHRVTAFARHPEKLALEHPELRRVQGDVLAPDSLARAIPGHDAVLLCVGSADRKAPTLRTDAARHTVAAMTAAGVRRLIAMSGLGAGITRKNMGFVFDRVIAPTTLRGLLADQNGLEAAVRMSGLDWILVRPGRMTESAPQDAQPAISLDGSGVTNSVSREDVVKFMLDQLESDDYLRKPAAIGY